MSTTLTENLASNSAADDPAERLKHTFSAMRISFTWLGVRKSLSSDQRQQAANQFGAQEKYISAGKKLIDTGHPAMRSVNQVRRQIVDYWKAMSLPFPESGIRLVRQDELTQLNGQMEVFGEQLAVAVSHLQLAYEEIKQQARDRLGSLYCESDYPEHLAGLFAIEWSFPSVEPPDYLRSLRPEIYEQECSRVRTKFAEAAKLAEQGFVEELSGLVSHLSERLTGSEDGKPKVFRDSVIENLGAFFERFSRLSISSSSELDELVQRARAVVSGVQPQTLRDNHSVRQQVATQLSSVQSVLDGLMVDRPRRRILRG